MESKTLSNNALCALAYYAEIKNEINRFRRRHYFRYIEASRSLKGEDAQFHLNKYEEAKVRMKELTPLMQTLQDQSGCKIRWGSSGQIQCIRVDLKTGLQMWPNTIWWAQHVEMYKADSIILGGDLP